MCLTTLLNALYCMQKNAKRAPRSAQLTSGMQSEQGFQKICETGDPEMDSWPAPFRPINSTVARRRLEQKLVATWCIHRILCWKKKLLRVAINISLIRKWHGGRPQEPKTYRYNFSANWCATDGILWPSRSSCAEISRELDCWVRAGSLSTVTLIAVPVVCFWKKKKVKNEFRKSWIG